MTSATNSKRHGSLREDVPSAHDLYEETVREHPTTVPPPPLDEELVTWGGSIVDEDSALWSAPPPPPPPISRPSVAPLEVPAAESPHHHPVTLHGPRPGEHEVRRAGAFALLAFLFGVGLTLGGVRWLGAGLDEEAHHASAAPMPEATPAEVAPAAPVMPAFDADDPLAAFGIEQPVVSGAPPISEEAVEPAEPSEEAEPPRAEPGAQDAAEQRVSKRDPEPSRPAARPASDDDRSKPAEPERVAAEPEPVASEPAAPAFDVDAARAAVAAAARVAAGCGDGTHTGSATVAVTVAPTGRVTTAVVQGGSLLGTPVASCIAQTMRSVSLPPHADGYVTVSRTITIR